jgi:Tfp pilus assembly PilM family ATPase
MKIKKLSALKKIVAKYGLQRHKVIAALPATDGILTNFFCLLYT